jgi:hypothetical protein
MLFGATASSLEPTRFEAKPRGHAGAGGFRGISVAGATREPAWAGPGATRGVATALEAAPNTRLGRDSRREIAGGPAPSTPSGHLARGITCPPPGVNRDPPAQAPAGTFRPGGRELPALSPGCRWNPAKHQRARGYPPSRRCPCQPQPPSGSIGQGPEASLSLEQLFAHLV